MASERVEVRGVCHLCAARNPHLAHEGAVTLTGRDALVYRIGETNAKWMGSRGSRNTNKRLHADYLDALADLRAWDAAATHRGCTGPMQPPEER